MPNREIPAPPGAAEAPPRYSSVQDYLRVIRRRRVLIGVITLLFTGGAIAGSLSRETVYEAEATVLFRDVLQDLRFLGGGGASLPEFGSAQRAALSAEKVTSIPVARAVKEELDSELSADQLADEVTTEVGIQTNLVSIVGSGPTGERAAEIANAFAEATQSILSRVATKPIRLTARSVEEDLKKARNDPLFPGRVGVLELQLSQVRTLEKITEPIEITHRAEEPSTPVSPNVPRDGIFGAVLGLVIGLVAAFGRDSLDRRLHNPREVHEELDVPVLGRIGEGAFAHAGLANNGFPMFERDFEAFRVLRTNLAFLGGDGPPPKSVLVTSGLPEEGKSTVSMSLASAACLTGQRVLLVECDLRRPSFSRRLGLAREPGLSDYLMGNAAPADLLQIVELTTPASVNGGSASPDRALRPKLVCIAAGSAVSVSAELLGSDRFRLFLEKVSRAYDLVVLDGAPLLAVVDPLAIVPHVDGVLVCVRVQQSTRDQVHAVRSALGHLPQKPTGLVVTGLNRSDPDSYDYDYGY